MLSTPSLKCRTLKYAQTSNDQDQIDNSTNSLSVMQYNILADAAVPSEDGGADLCGSYKYCPAESRYMDSECNVVLSAERKL